MILVVDVGNTNVVAGVFKGDDLICSFRLGTDVNRTVDEYRVLMKSMLREYFDGDVHFQRSVMSSVVPPLTSKLSAVLSAMSCPPLIVGPGIKTGLSIRTLEPAAVGADRIVNAVAAKSYYGLPAMVVDFGTATSIDVVDEESNYLGGVIAPGVEVALEALVRRTAKLPKIDLVWPESAIGRSTVEAMRSGSILGYSCLIEGLLERIQAEQGSFQHIIATGGLGKIFSEQSKHMSSYDPHLTLKGLCVIASLNP